MPMESPTEPLLPEPQDLESRPDDLSFALRREQVNLTSLLSRASEAWSRDLGTWVLAMLLYWLLGMGIPFALSMVWGLISAFQESGAEASLTYSVVNSVVQIVVYLAQLVIGAIFALGIWALAIRGVLGRPASVGVLFSQLSKVWKYIVQGLAVGTGVLLFLAPIVVIILLVFVGPVDLATPMEEIIDDAGRPFLITSVVLLPVYAYVFSGLAFIHAELAFNDDAGPVDAILHSWQIARGKRWRIIGVFLVAGFILSGSAMMCGIGLLFGAPFAILLYAALYLGLRNGADVPAPNTATTLGRQY